jgi:hypothetical protein
MGVDALKYRFMIRTGAVVAVMLSISTAAVAQGVVGDLLAGKLINPKVGQWAWYNLVASQGGKKYVIRQAIVGAEKVGRKDGYWVEFEIVPEVGYKLIYKMLLTGPASDPENIHRVIQKNGTDPAEEVPVEPESTADKEAKPSRHSLGLEDVVTGDGPIRAERFSVTQGSKTFDVWINEKVYPTGIVRLRSLDGEMILRNHGQGGEYAQSAIRETALSSQSPNTASSGKPRIRAEAGEPKATAPEAGAPPAPNEEAQP